MASNIHTLHKKRTYVGGPENERENKRKCLTYSDIIGTSQHENRKEQMKQCSAENYSYSDTIDSPLHKQMKEQMRTFSASKEQREKEQIRKTEE